MTQDHHAFGPASMDTPVHPLTVEHLPHLIHEAMAAEQHRDFERSIELFGRAHQLDKTNVDVLLHLGLGHGWRCDYPAAENYFEKAVNTAVNTSWALLQAGWGCVIFENFEMADRFLRRAAVRGDCSPEVFVHLAEICARRHRPEEGLELIEIALKKSPWPRAIPVQARLLRQCGKAEESETILRCFLRGSGYDPWAGAQGWYELGALLDRKGDYEAAMSAILQAKSLLLPGAKPLFPLLRQAQAQIQGSLTGISAEVVRCWLGDSDKFQPARRLALLGGHPRSGTTLLEQVLDAHPAISTAEETTIFEDEICWPFLRKHGQGIPLVTALGSLTPDAMHQMRERFFRCNELFLGRGLQDRLLIEKNPALNALLPVMLRIFPETRFLFTLRDPRDVCLSCFMQPLSMNPTSSSFLTMEGTVGQYATVMGFWRSFLPLIPDSHLVVRYEDLVTDLESASRRALQFLGLEWDARVLRFAEHAQKKLVRSPSFAEVAKPLFQSAVGRWKNYGKYLAPHLEKLEPFAKAFGYA